MSRRARTEDVGVSSSVHFASAAGYGEPSSRARNIVMGGIALLAAALAWKIALSPVGPSTAAAARDSASPAALITAAPVAVPPPAASTVAPVAPITPPAVTTTAAPAAPKAAVAKPVRAPVRAPTSASATAPSPLADEPTRLNGGPAGSVANARSSPYLTSPVDAGAVSPAVGSGKAPGDDN